MLRLKKLDTKTYSRIVKATQINVIQNKNPMYTTITNHQAPIKTGISMANVSTQFVFKAKADDV
jgi:hypothetical protein